MLTVAGMLLSKWILFTSSNAPMTFLSFRNVAASRFNRYELMFWSVKPVSVKCLPGVCVGRESLGLDLLQSVDARLVHCFGGSEGKQHVVEVDVELKRRDRATCATSSKHGCAPQKNILPPNKVDLFLFAMEDLTFHTKTINWRDWLGEYHMNNVLLQNKNGPCFIISLVNSLVLASELSNDEWSTVGKARSSPSKTQAKTVPASDLSSLKKLLVSRKVGLASLLNELTHLMLALNETKQDPVDIGEILNVLPHLGTGLNVNPVFTNPVVGDFGPHTHSILQLLHLFQLKVVHGFLVEAGATEFDTFDKYQDFLISVLDRFSATPLDTMGADEILALDVGPDDRATLAKYVEYRQFLADNSTQLTAYGLETLKSDATVVPNNGVVILFRNDHFTTLYKQEDKLYLLANDEGYGGDIVWEELNTVTGQHDELLNGFFEVRVGEPAEAESVAAESDAEAGADQQLAAQLQSQEDERIARDLQREYQTKKVLQDKARDKKPDTKRNDKCFIV
ncbi:hypothetical protein OGAPHI_003361 [Ogataea philodendri]|uniref:MINDY deubiquitinase domain-containing protein n=1 Tax=Ogataea philodendri TaxID=1378263 RepID=A0A9P8P883_9ASCO|nr:uncharacterized protein OGAPHI_003361 [Ogataea philodendri]KAH3666911.1 hypothetical protein OGAPHI_003361 [Ogataea philodendri]